MSPTDIQSFAAAQLALLEVEHSAEIEETAILTAAHAPIVLQRAGLALLNLHVVGQRTGFAGRTQIDLALDPTVANGEFPEHGLSSGDLCAVAEQPKGSEKKRDREVIEAKKVTGVVQRVRREDISVALDKDDAEMPQGGKLWLYVQPQQSEPEHYRRSGTIVGTGRLIDILSPSQCQTRQRDNPQTAHADYEPSSKTHTLFHFIVDAGPFRPIVSHSDLALRP
jgi:hypothetical protein